MCFSVRGLHPHFRWRGADVRLSAGHWRCRVPSRVVRGPTLVRCTGVSPKCRAERAVVVFFGGRLVCPTIRKMGGIVRALKNYCG